MRDFLVSQGVSLSNVAAQGFGPTNPVASNSTPQGRQMNRRVDLVVNGESIAAQERPTDNVAPTSMAEPSTSNPRQQPPPQSNNLEQR